MSRPNLTESAEVFQSGIGGRDQRGGIKMAFFLMRHCRVSTSVLVSF